MSVKSIVQIVSGFIGHYGREADTIATALTTIINTVPIPPADRAKIIDAINTFEGASKNIADAITRVENATVPVKISRADIADVIKNEGFVKRNEIDKLIADALAKNNVLVKKEN